MVAKPPIQWFPADVRNYGTRPSGVFYEGIVLHTTAGGRTIADLGRWFGGENQRQGMAGSTHFGVDLEGKIGQFVSLQHQPIAHGAESGATAKIARDPGNAGVSMNAVLIGIEHLDGGTPGTVTEAQLEASARLAAWLWATEIAPHATRTGAVLDRDHILTHAELAPTSRGRCPSWPPDRITAYIARVGEVLTGEPPVPPVPEAELVRLRLRERELVNALTVQAKELRQQSAALGLQAANLEAIVAGKPLPHPSSLQTG